MSNEQKHPLNCKACSENHIKTKCPLYLAGQKKILTPDECLLMNAMIAKIGCATCEIQPLDVLEALIKGDAPGSINQFNSASYQQRVLAYVRQVKQKYVI